MSQANVVRLTEVSIEISGELTFRTVLSARKALENELKQSKQAQSIDFSKITLADSSALSFWLCAKREAKRLGIEIKAQALPQDIQSLCHMMGFDQNGESRTCARS